MEVMDAVHGILDVAGFIPVVGAAFDVVNAVIYAVEGEWECAGLSVVAAIPGAGDAAAVGCIGLKVGVKTTKAAKAAKTAKAAGALEKAKKMDALFHKPPGKAKTGAKKTNAQNSKKSAFSRKKNQNKAQSKEAGSCFTGDMRVYTENGFCCIKKIKNGDFVYSRNAQTGESGFRKVYRVAHSHAHTIYQIRLDGEEEIKTTAYHPFYVKEKGWVNAIHLTEGAVLATTTGQARITKIFKIRQEEPVEVYNFQVEEWKSYFVSGMRVYVHNGNPCANDGPYKRPVSGSGKEKATDVPTWAKGNRPKKNESGKDFAKRLCDERFGKGNYNTGPKSDFNKIKKWGDRGFE